MSLNPNRYPCRICHFWAQKPGHPEDVGTCHYNPPSIGMGYNSWPETHALDWCGMWQEDAGKAYEMRDLQILGKK